MGLSLIRSKKLKDIMKCFHRTTTENADQILRNGFKDNPKTKSCDFAGIWFSDGEPYGPDEGAKGDVVLSVEIPNRVFRKYYNAEHNPDAPAACIPAKIVNKYRVYLYEHDLSGSRESLLARIAYFRERGDKEKADYVENVVLPFLEQYNLLHKQE